MKAWMWILAIVIGVVFGAGAMFVWFMVQMMDAILN